MKVASSVLNLCTSSRWGQRHYVFQLSVHLCMCTCVHIGWHRINRTIQLFNGVYENVHKIMPLTLVVHSQMRRQKRNVHLNILQ